MRSASVRTRPLSRAQGSMRAPSNASNTSGAVLMTRSQSRGARERRKRGPTPDRDAYRTSASRASTGSGIIDLAPFAYDEFRVE